MPITTNEHFNLLKKHIAVLLALLFFTTSLQAQTPTPKTLNKLQEVYNQVAKPESSFEEFAKANAHVFSKGTTLNSLFRLCSSTTHTACGGGDFETGLIASEWQGAYGIWYSGDPNPASLEEGLLSGNIFSSAAHHTIVDSIEGVDPVTGIKLYAPNGGRKSLRLGNAIESSGTELISKTITVSASNPIYSFWYAVVFEDPNHDFEDQPSFSVRVYDCANGGKEINGVCNLGNGYNKVVSDIANPFFSVTRYGGENIAYRDWSCAQINLSQYIGKKVTIVFTNKDCALSGHFGYTYIDNFGLNEVCNSCKGSPSGYIFTAANNNLCGNNKICANYTLPRVGTKKGAINITLDIYQNGLKVDSIKSGAQTKDSTTYCFTIDTAKLKINKTKIGFDYVLTGNFSLDTFKLSPLVVGFAPDGVRAGSNNDYRLKCVAAGITGTDTVCKNDPSPVIKFKGLNGIPPYTFDYTINGGATQTITSVSGDTAVLNAPTSLPGKFIYRVLKVTDSDGYSQPQALTATITVNDLPGDTISASGKLTFCSGDSVLLTAPAGKSYLWSNGSTQPKITVKSSGSFTVKVTNANGCSITTTKVTVTVNPYPSALITITGNTTFCSGGSVTLSAPAGNTYLWSNGLKSQSIMVASTSNNTVAVTNASGCTTNSVNVPVTVIPSAVASVQVAVAPTATICPGTSLTFTATPVNGGTPVYQWKKNGVNVGTNGTTYTTASLIDGDSVWVVMTSNAACVVNPNVNSNKIIVTVVALPSDKVSVTGATTFCSGGSVTLTASQGSTFLWSNGSVIRSIVVTISGNYDVTVSNRLGCNVKSATIPVVVIPKVSPSVSVSISPNDTICTGTATTFTATAINGGTIPAYQWKKNNVNVGTNSKTYTDITLKNNDSVWVVLTSNATCVTTSTATSNKIKMTVNPILTPSVSVSVGPNDTICTGTATTFTATAVNGGTTPIYQWKKNNTNVGTNSKTYTDNNLKNKDSVWVVLTSNAPCLATRTVISNRVKMTVNPILTPSVSVSVGPNDTICTGTATTFTATAVNGGTTPIYQWKKNNTNVGTNSKTYTDNNLKNKDSVWVVLTSNAPCLATRTATSNRVKMTVNPILTPSVSVSVGPNDTICTGTATTFTATAINGGTIPAYQWKKNHVNVGTNSKTYTDIALKNKDSVWVVLTSNATCLVTRTAISNRVKMTVNPIFTPSVSVSISPNDTICTGTATTFTATAVNGGTTPIYQWKKNNTNVGTNSKTYTDITLKNEDSVWVVLTSNATCVPTSTATSNKIKMTVNPILTPSVSVSVGPNDTICTGTATTFTATAVNGGTTPIYQWKKNNTNVGTNSKTYTDNTLKNKDSVWVVLTSNATCLATRTVISNRVKMTVNPILTPSVSVSVGPNDTICTGTATFTATAINGGTIPAYQWKKNNVNVGTNSKTYTDNTLKNIDSVWVVLTSNATCVTTSTTTSNKVGVGGEANTWLGLTTDWSTPSNWSLGKVPSGCTKVIIHTGAPNMPSITGENNICFTLSLQNGATINMATGAKLIITGK